MAIVFRESDHQYLSVDGDNIKWLSATGVLKLFEKPFDPDQARKSSENKKGKWFGMNPELITKIWDTNRKNATDLGHWYHLQEENKLNLKMASIHNSLNLDVSPALKRDNGGLVDAPCQKLKNNTIYPEHLCYMKSAGICGQSDIVEVLNQEVNIGDHKTSQFIETESFKEWDNVNKCRSPKMMTGILSHLEDCNFNHYSIQLSLYMFMVLRHNFNYKPGKMFVYHVKFDEDGVDQYGYRIIKKNDAGEPMVKEVIPIEIPYLKSEAAAIVNYLKEQNQQMKQAA